MQLNEQMMEIRLIVYSRASVKFQTEVNKLPTRVSRFDKRLIFLGCVINLRKTAPVT